MARTAMTTTTTTRTKRSRSRRRLQRRRPLPPRALETSARRRDDSSRAIRAQKGFCKSSRGFGSRHSTREREIQKMARRDAASRPRCLWDIGTAGPATRNDQFWLITGAFVHFLVRGGCSTTKATVAANAAARAEPPSWPPASTDQTRGPAAAKRSDQAIAPALQLQTMRSRLPDASAHRRQ